MSGAVAGYRSFTSAFGANQAYYLIVNRSTPSEWEIGLFAVNGAVLDRSSGAVIDSSNAGARVNFTAGIKDVYNVSPAVDAETSRTNLGLASAALATVETVRQIPQNSQSVAYTLVAADAGKHIFHPSSDATARTYTIPANASVAYPVGTAITFVNRGGTITIDITSDTLRLAPSGSTGSRTLATNGLATAIKIDTTEWLISGAGLT
jgi:hypothetical protein